MISYLSFYHYDKLQVCVESITLINGLTSNSFINLNLPLFSIRHYHFLSVK